MHCLNPLLGWLCWLQGYLQAVGFDTIVDAYSFFHRLSSYIGPPVRLKTYLIVSFQILIGSSCF